LNAAAYNQVDVAEREPQAAFLANALGVRNLALACRQLDSHEVGLGLLKQCLAKRRQSIRETFEELGEVRRLVGHGTTLIALFPAYYAPEATTCARPASSVSFT
jgi:hypothetical protein